MCAHVLVAEDDEMQAELIRRSLLTEGHTATVVHDGGAAIAAARTLHPDLVVLDLMLPVIDGFGVCRALREDDIPVLMLTARSTEDDVLLGLELGADDYHDQALQPARTDGPASRTVLRRSGRTTEGRQEDTVVRAAGLIPSIPRAATRCAATGAPVDCTPAEFEILLAMTAEPERVFSPAAVASVHQGPGPGVHGTGRRRSTIMNLRRKIEADPRKPARLLTVFGVGYKLRGGRA